MATMLDHRSQAALPLGYGYTTPQFRDPWASSNALANTQALYQTSSVLPISPPQQQSPSNESISNAYQSVTPEAIQQQARAVYASGYPSTNGYAQSTNDVRYSPEHFTNGSSYAPYDQAVQAVQRRPSYPAKPAAISRDSYTAALDASEGMLAMSQDITPRNAYPPRHGSQDAYGFPVAHSTHSSISSASGYPHYYHGSYHSSVDGSIAGSSVTDYTSDAEHLAGRALHSSHLGASFHQEQASMMTQFNSKMSASAQKKHKCKICDKRFTRPSSLQTHMYSHTGEKPFACDFEGCGRHFSVVSNLRRHKKCHRGSVDRTSPEDDASLHRCD